MSIEDILYALFTNGEISLTQYLDCCKPDVGSTESIRKILCKVE